MRHAIALLICLWASVAAAEVNVYPPDGESVGIVTSDTPGRWMVFRAAPFGVVSSQQCTVGGVDGCMWTAEGGLFTAVLVPNDQALPFEFGTVNLGKDDGDDDDGDDDDGPDPPKPPPPGPRLVMVVEEQTERTPELGLAYQRLQDYCQANNHVWRLVDDDTVHPDGSSVERLQRFLDWFKEQGWEVPVLVVAVKHEGQEKAWGVPFPKSSDAAIEFVKTHGG
jgi:hypothetical protein